MVNSSSISLNEFEEFCGLDVTAKPTGVMARPKLKTSAATKGKGILRLRKCFRNHWTRSVQRRRLAARPTIAASDNEVGYHLRCIDNLLKMSSSEFDEQMVRAMQSQPLLWTCENVDSFFLLHIHHIGEVLSGHDERLGGQVVLHRCRKKHVAT